MEILPQLQAKANIFNTSKIEKTKAYLYTCEKQTKKFLMTKYLEIETAIRRLLSIHGKLQPSGESLEMTGAVMYAYML